MILHVRFKTKEAFLKEKKMWYILSFEASIALKPGIEASLDGLRVAFQRGLAPSNVSILVGDLDK